MSTFITLVFIDGHNVPFLSLCIEVFQMGASLPVRQRQHPNIRRPCGISLPCLVQYSLNFPATVRALESSSASFRIQYPCSIGPGSMHLMKTPATRMDGFQILQQRLRVVPVDQGKYLTWLQTLQMDQYLIPAKVFSAKIYNTHCSASSIRYARCDDRIVLVFTGHCDSYRVDQQRVVMTYSLSRVSIASPSVTKPNSLDLPAK
jgi:hypothetical protein